MRIRVLIILTLIFNCSFLNGQGLLSLTFNTSKNINKPYDLPKRSNQINPDNDRIIWDLNDYKRISDFHAGLSYNKNINETINLDLSLKVTMILEEVSTISNSNGIDLDGSPILTEVYTESHKGTAFGLILPISMNFNLYKSKLFCYGGINVSIDRILRINNFSQIDSELIPNYLKLPYNSKLGFGTQIGIIYYYKKVGLDINYTASRINEYSFSNIGIGFKYQISKL